MTWTRCRWRRGCAGRPGAGKALAWSDADYASRRRDLGDQGDAPELPWGHSDFVLAAAVRQGILTRARAGLIGRNRLEGIPMAQIAAEMRISHAALCNRRKRAEKALTDAIRNGRLSDIASDATYDAVRERRRSGAT